MTASETTRVCRLLAIAVSVFATASVVTTTAAEPDKPQQAVKTKEHKLLKFDVGMWDATVRIWPKPGADPIESKATEKNQLLRGGLWLLSRFDGKIGEVPFAGHGVFGYDPYEKKFVGTWVDSQNPYMLTMKGDYDESTKTLTMMGENREPDGKIHKSKEISRRIDDNTRHFELHMQGDDGQYFKMMEIDYKRQPADKAK